LIKNDIRNITVIAMYRGQKDELKKSLSKCSTHLNPVDSFINIATVDDFQGEENDIIILSLVCSNKIGFLKEKTRTCVAMTRARLGMFVIGNLEFLTETSDVWRDLIEQAKSRKIYGDGIPLTCRTHPQNNMVARTGKDSKGLDFDDFDKRPDGGCSLDCGQGLSCGHLCPKCCHSDDKNHTIVKCNKPCSKDANCEFNQHNEIKHKCQQTCRHEGDCNICSIKILKHMTECGHDIMFECSKQPKKSDCLSNCKKTLTCGHNCQKKCNEICEPCIYPMEVTSPCRHKSKVLIDCGDLNKTWIYASKCEEKCATSLVDCGHICEAKCGECFLGELHQPCYKICARVLFCGHDCSGFCTEFCPPCTQPCVNKCEHFKCDRLCNESCIKCLEPCLFECEHFKCTSLCSDIHHLEHCKERCKIVCEFGHACLGFCNEPCPPCALCNDDEYFEPPIADTLQCELDVCLIESVKDKYIMLECGHVFEVEQLSGYIDYALSQEIQYPRCYFEKKLDPNNKTSTIKCNQPIVNVARYKKQINRMLADMEKVKWRINQRTDNDEIHYNKIKQEIKTHLSRTPIYICLDTNYFKKEQIIGINKQIMIKNIAHSYFIINCLKDKIKSAKIKHFDELEHTRAYLEKYIMDVVKKKNN
jgi:hypothetical protein